MIRSLILKASAALASTAMVFAFVASPAQAATFTFNDTNCDSFSLAGSAPSQTLNCIVSNAPSGCTISGPTTGTINVPVTLTATCATGSANAWTWTGGNCAGLTTQSCAANSGSVGPVPYTVTPRNNVGAGNTAATTVTWSNTPPQAPSGCTLGASTGTLPIGGGAVTLTASCSGGGAPTSYAWTAAPSPTSGFSTTTAGAVQTPTIGATTFFTVTPSNAGGSGNQATVSVNVTTNNPGFCNQFSNVLPIINATWGQAALWQSTAIGNFGDGNTTVWVFKLTVPAGTQNSSYIGRFWALEYQGPTTFRQMTISTQACDFRAKDYTGANGPLAVSNGTTVSVSYGVATPFIFGPAGLTAGQTYYVNVRNWQLDPSPQNSCAQTTCNAIMNLDPALP
jgi:hypothetical protein